MIEAEELGSLGDLAAWIANKGGRSNTGNFGILWVVTCMVEESSGAGQDVHVDTEQ